MKYRLLIIICMMTMNVPVALFANDNPTKQAEDFYANKEYEKALALYEQMMEQGVSAGLYYNYANTLFKTNQLGKAILYYEKALVLSPNDKDIKQSLAFANTMKTDKIDGYEPFFISQWLSNIACLLNTNQWAVVSISFFVIALCLLILFRFSTLLFVRKASFYIAIIALLVSTVSFVYAFYQRTYQINNPYWIVVDGAVSVKSSPNATGKELFVIHEGTKVRLLDTNGGWQKIEIADKRIGWVDGFSTEQI